MRLTGFMFDVEGLDEYDSDVTDAAVTTKQIMFDWVENGEHLHALLKSSDGGFSYVGHFGSPHPERQCVMEASRYNGKGGEILLWVTWHRKDTGDEGTSLIHLASDWD